jgi:hypothetical protein
MYHLYALFLIYTWQSLILFFFFFSPLQGVTNVSRFVPGTTNGRQLRLCAGRAEAIMDLSPWISRSLSYLYMCAVAREGGRERSFECDVVALLKTRLIDSRARAEPPSQRRRYSRRAALLHSGWAEREKKKKTSSATQDGKKGGLYDMRDVSWIVHI